MKGENLLRTIKLNLLLILALMIAAALPLTALAAASPFPEILPLPDGFSPEGIAVGKGASFYSGSLIDGAIYRGDVRTGAGAILAPGSEGRVAVGMKFDGRRGYLFVAGGPTGQAYVFDGSSGDLIAQYDLAPGFINDVIVTSQAAYFTNSSVAEFYSLPLSSHGTLPDQADVQTIPLSGDWEQVDGFNANGIAATPNGEDLIIVNSAVGAVYKVDPSSGEAVLIDLGGGDVSSGDGLVLTGSTLFVVRNFLNQIVVVELAPDLESGEIVDIITNPNFDIPTTAALFGNALYVVNARFSTPPGPDVPYWVVRVPLN
jgi:hypothetical protein